MSNTDENVLKKWRPGTQEVESFFVKYTQDGERFGMYVTAVDNRDARSQVSRIVPNAMQIEAKQQSPTEDHKQKMKELDEQSNL